MVAEYIEYFRRFAEQHQAIGHQRINEGQNGDPYTCRFGRFWNLDLYLESPPDGLKTSATTVQVQLFDAVLQSPTGHYDVRASMEGGVLITQQAIKNDRVDEERCLTECYNIALDLITLMYQNSGSFCPRSFAFDYDRIKITPVGPIWDNRFGWWLTFGIDQLLNLHTRTVPLITNP